ncbi:hypothetical protein L2E82_45606 [Cichorium intybus]|uniref:Uncharacterized protein n=1 Tax=Cichorium intybus TaxID=13427 RepID=A0ACB8ZUB9_CICIN|nr:hypothetical protein L2E82_45606 [Cichorium intybus]
MKGNVTSYDEDVQCFKDRLSSNAYFSTIQVGFLPERVAASDVRQVVYGHALPDTTNSISDTSSRYDSGEISGAFRH